MKLTSILVLLSISLSPLAKAQSVLYFQARIQNERLAEEAIEFLHCVSERAELPWELSESRSKHTLSLKEEAGALTGELKLGERKEEIRLALGEGIDTCEKLFPSETRSEAALPLETVTTPKSNKTWLTVGSIALAIGLGVFLWKQRGPDYHGIEMRR